MTDQQVIYEEKEVLKALREELNKKIETLSEENEGLVISNNALKKERNDLFVEVDELKQQNSNLSSALQNTENKANDATYRLSVLQGGITSLAQSAAYVGGSSNV